MLKIKGLCFAGLLFLFVISILVRLPNLGRPLSKHHEFVAATVLINLESWRQAGGAGIFHFTPVTNFQNPGDRSREKGVYIDQAGNQLYLSLGPGMFVLPYLFYECLNLPSKPVYLQALNLTLNLGAVILLFILTDRILPIGQKDRYIVILTVTFLYLFSPGMLWYSGNGYIQTAVMMPLIFIFLLLLLPMLQNPEKIRPLRLGGLATSLLLLIYFDWMGVFLAAVGAVLACGLSMRDSRYWRLVVTLILTALCGALLIFYQFSSYAGYGSVLSYWQSRFLVRGFGNHPASILWMSVHIASHLATAFLPILILLTVSLIWLMWKKIPLCLTRMEMIFVGLYGISLLVYNGVFLEWSYEHEFSIIPAAPLLAFLAAKAMAIVVTDLRYRTSLLLLVFAATLAQYYYINRPGAISRDKMAYASYQHFGNELKNVSPDTTIFISIENCPMIEYYAGRNLKRVPDLDSAKHYMLRWGVNKAVWIDHDKFDFQRATPIH